MKALLLTLTLLASQFAFAEASRTLKADVIQNNTNGASFTVPTVGAALLTDSSTATLSNKTISGANNTFSNLPAAALTGIAAVANGGTGASSLASGSVVIGQGTSAVTTVAPGTSGNILTSNGSAWLSSAPPAGGGTTNVVATKAAPQAITSATAIAVTGQITNGPNLVFISGSGGPQTVTATPSITACTAAGEYLSLVGGANAVTLQDEAALAGSKLQLNGNITLALNQTISFVCDAAAGNWVEVSRK